MLANIMAGAQNLLTLDAVLALVAGTVGGMVIGALPGFSAAMGVSLLIPITYGMNPVAALTMLVAMYTSAIYGGSITAILCHTPGTPASAATAIDGYQLTKKGRGMEAMGVATFGSALGGHRQCHCYAVDCPCPGSLLPKILRAGVFPTGRLWTDCDRQFGWRLGYQRPVFRCNGAGSGMCRPGRHHRCSPYDFGCHPTGGRH